MNKEEKDIEAIAYEIASLEQKIKTTPLGKSVQRYEREIENLMKGLSLKQLWVLNDTVSDILRNN